MAEKLERLWIVSASRGQYADRTEWTVCAFKEEAEGQAFAVKCERALRDAAARYRAGAYYNRSQDEDRKLVAELNAELPDPFVSCEDYGADDASYYCGVLHVGRAPTRPEWEAELAEIIKRREGAHV